MSDPSAAFDVPEFDRIGHLMNDLFGTGDAPAPARRPPAPRPARRRAGKSRLGPTTLAAFAGAVNWKNAADFATPPGGPAPAPARVGGHTVAAFAGMVNWRNAAAVAGPAPEATPTLDTFLSEFNWD
jgi:hypothetical protein